VKSERAEAAANDLTRDMRCSFVLVRFGPEHDDRDAEPAAPRDDSELASVSFFDFNALASGDYPDL